MNTNARPPKPGKSKSVAGGAPVKQKKAAASLVPAPLQRKGKDDEKVMQHKAAPAQRMGKDDEKVMQHKAVQRMGKEEEKVMQHKAAPAQRMGKDEEKVMQHKAVQRVGKEEEKVMQHKAVQRMGKEEEKVMQHKAAPVQKAGKTSPNKTGLPDQLKSGIENLSGYSMDDVKVHYNSPQPATLQAHAYAQGTDIHVAAGQEKHLAHEAWHVVQQKQGRVKPTTQLKEKGVPVNDDKGLEHEADVMGSRALQMKSVHASSLKQAVVPGDVQQLTLNSRIVRGESRLKPQVRAKLDEVNTYLHNSVIGMPTGLTFINLRVQKMYGANPASTRRINGNTEILVNIAEWFVRTSTVGEIAGMISHEIGVHSLTDDQLQPHEKLEEKRRLNQTFTTKVGDRRHKIRPWKKGTKGRQRDHIAVGKDTGKGHKPNYGPGQFNPRAEHYAQTTLRLGDDIEADATITLAERNKRLYDLLNSFLFDYARIIVTDDVGYKTLTQTGLVAEVYNWYKDVFIRRYSGTHAWLLRPAMQPTATKWNLRGYLAKKITRGLIEQLRTNWVSDNVVDPAVNLVGAGIGLGVRGITATAGGAYRLGRWGYNRIFG